MMPLALSWCFLCSLTTSLADIAFTLIRLLLPLSSSAHRANGAQLPGMAGSDANESLAAFSLAAINQLLLKSLIYMTINLVCLYTKYLIDLAQRNAFLETRRSIETRAKIEKENDKQERLLLSLLPRFVALEIIADIAKEDNHDKLLKNQFHKIYIHSYTNVRLVALSLSISLSLYNEICIHNKPSPYNGQVQSSQ